MAKGTKTREQQPIDELAMLRQGMSEPKTSERDHKHVEEALRESEQRYRILFESAGDAIFILEAEGEKAGRIVAANQAAAEMHGYTIDELVSLNIRDLDTPDAAEEAPDLIRRIFKGERIKKEITHRKKDGTVFPVEISAGLLELSDHRYILAFDRDITERKKAEEDLHRSEKKLRDIASSLAEGIYVLDTHGHITFMNEEAERLLGWTLSELMNKNAHALVHYQRLDGTLLALEDCPMYHVIQTGKKFSSRDEVFTRKDGTVFPISVLTSPIIENGKVVASVTAFRDITERKKLETELLQAQKLESIGILAGGIAHDFNNLLQAIIGNISLAKMKTREDTVYDRLTKAEKAAEQAKELSYRLLTFSKGGEPIRKTIYIRSLLMDAVRFSLSGSSITAELALADDLYPVEIDEGQMNQVINNLVKNAEEAMPGGGIIEVRANNITVGKEEGPPLKKGKYVKITIKDHGIGIPKQNLSKIFDPYFTTKDMGHRKGSGLGLAISHSIIKKHSGLINVDSEEGMGTLFHIYLPASQEPVEKKETGYKRHMSGKGKILVMDDEERVRDICGEMLKYLTYEVQYARDGDEAIDLYQKAKESGQPFDVVIMDLTIAGGMGGEKAMKRLLDVDPEIKGVVSSGYTNDPIMTDYRAYGFRGALAKPYRIEQLSEILKRAMKEGERSVPTATIGRMAEDDTKSL